MRSGEIVRVLLIEDDEDDYVLTRELLDDIGSLRYDTVWEKEPVAGLNALCSGAFDVVLIDYYLCGRTGIDILAAAHSMGVGTPAILLTGAGNEHLDYAAMQAGAYDYLEKGNLTSCLLDRSIRYAVQAARARAEIGEKTALLEMTLHSADAGIALFNRSGRIVNWNPRFLTLLDMEDPRSPAEFEKIVRERLLSHVDSPNGRSEYRRRGGRVTEIRCEASPDGGLVIVCIDITERVAMEARLIAARETAEAASDAKSKFIANVSHELRTPLTAIIDSSEALGAAASGASEQNADTKRHVGDIRDSAGRLLHLIDGILDLTRIEAGQWTVHRDAVDPGQILRAAMARLSADAKARGVALEVSNTAGFVWLYSDPGSLRQIVENLFANAVKFTNAGGRAVAAVERRQDGGLTLSVTDTGIGIPPTALHRILEPFEQGTHAPETTRKGVGLGLTIAKRLVELLGGRLSIESEVNQGTRVAVEFPPSRTVPLDTLDPQMDTPLLRQNG